MTAYEHAGAASNQSPGHHQFPTPLLAFSLHTPGGDIAYWLRVQHLEAEFEFHLYYFCDHGSYLKSISVFCVAVVVV